MISTLKIINDYLKNKESIARKLVIEREFKFLGVQCAGGYNYEVSFHIHVYIFFLLAKKSLYSIGNLYRFLKTNQNELLY